MIIDIVDVGQWQSVHTQQLINSFITGVTILVVAVPEGLPLAVTLSLAYSVNKMKQQKNLVRHLDACEVMGGATNICTDKTGTLTENIMTVVKLWTVGQEYNAVELKKDDLDDAVRELLVDHMCNNSTAEVEVKDGKTEFGGSRSECALLQFSENLGTNYHSKREKQRIVKMLPFSSDLKLMGVCLKYNDDFNIIYVKGASERVLDKCEHYLGSNGNQHPLDEEIKVSAIDAIGAYAD